MLLAAWHCRRARPIRCPQCQATLAIDSLKAAYAAVRALEAGLRHAQAHPSPQAVKRRLGALDTDLARQREYIDELSRENAYGADANWKFRGSNRWFDADKWKLRLILGAGFLVWLLLQFATGIKRH